MKPLFLVGMGVLVLLGARGVGAQTVTPPLAKGAGLGLGAFRFDPAQSSSLNLHLTDVDAVGLVRQISLGSNLDVVVVGRVTGKIAKVDLDNVSPERALERVVELAGLDWKLEGKTYIVSAKAPVPVEKSRVIDLVYEDVPVLELLDRLARQEDLQIVLTQYLEETERIQCIHLKNVSPEEAVEKIARAANLVCRKKDGYYLLMKPDEK